MQDILEDLASRCRAILENDPGPAGREQVAGLLSNALKDPQMRD